MHNHPYSNEFSYGDLGVFYNLKVKTLTMVTNKGKVRVLNKTKKLDNEKFFAILREERAKYDNPLKHQDEIASAVLKRCKEFGVQYIRW